MNYQGALSGIDDGASERTALMLDLVSRDGVSTRSCTLLMLQLSALLTLQIAAECDCIQNSSRRCGNLKYGRVWSVCFLCVKAMFITASKQLFASCSWIGLCVRLWIEVGLCIGMTLICPITLAIAIGKWFCDPMGKISRVNTIGGVLYSKSHFLRMFLCQCSCFPKLVGLAWRCSRGHFSSYLKDISKIGDTDQ